MRTHSLNRLTLVAILLMTIRFAGVTVGGESESPGKPAMQEEMSAEVTVKAKFNYLLSLPEDYYEKAKHPLMLFLHGAGERGDNQLDLVKIHGPPKMIARGKRFPCVVVSPQCPPNQWWDAAELSALLDHIEANYKIDKQRIYVTGLSMGGYGTWSLAMREPNRFAAIAPICGGGNTWAVDYLGEISAAIWAFHGAKDAVIPVSELHAMRAAQLEKGVEMKVTIYPEAEHDSWTKAYEANDELFTWLFSHSRE